MNTLAQPNAFKMLLRSLRERLKSQSKAQTSPGIPLAEPGAAVHAPTSHAPMNELGAETPETDEPTADAGEPTVLNPSPEPASWPAVQPAAPVRFEVDLNGTAFASVFSLGNDRIPEPQRHFNAAPASAPITSPIDLNGLEALDRELALLDTSRPGLDDMACKQAKFNLHDMNDLKLIKGIGPKIGLVLNEAGIRNFGDLSECTEQGLRKILDRAGPRYRLARPALWIEQASLAANNRWRELRDWQQTHGKRRRRNISATTAKASTD